MLTHLKNYWHNSPLTFALVIGFILRLIAVLFAKGYGMHDDHFLIIEAAQSWVDGYDYNDWLPSNSDSEPSGHSFFYVGLHYLLFEFLELINIYSPDIKMYIVRFLHAVYSLSVIYLGYKITILISTKHIAKHIALLLACFWFLPWLSVHNMVEFVCIPPLMYATYMLLKYQKKQFYKYILLAGLIGGLAVGIRYQSVLFLFGLGVVLLLQKKLIPAIIFGISALVSFFITQGSDLFIWGKPFAELEQYIVYNLENSTTYFAKPWYMYLLTVAGLLIPPISIFFCFGYLRLWKKHLLLFLPSLLFFAFHSYFPNKQERFIIPILPFVFILGFIGWIEFKNKSQFWLKNSKLIKSFWIFFIVINTILLSILSTSYMKRSRVETMLYLSKKTDLTNYIWECSHRGDYLLPPNFYAGKYYKYAWTTSEKRIKRFTKSYERLNSPNYIVFVEDVNLEKRIKEAEKIFPHLKYETTIEAGFLDRILHNLNPHNKFEKFYIYKITQKNF